MVIIVLLEFILGISILVVVKKFSDPNSEENHKWTSQLISSVKNNSAAIRDAWDITQNNGVCYSIKLSTLFSMFI